MRRYQKRSILVGCFFIILSLSTARAEHLKLEADVAVIGAGGAGLAAAVTAADGGANVIVLEKMPVAGGSTNYAKGIFAVESALQKERGINITTHEAFLAHMEYTHWLANPTLVRAIIDKSADTIDWLDNKGVEFIEPAVLYPGAPATWHTISGLGAGIIQALKRSAQAHKIRILYRTTALELIMKRDRTAGVIAKDRDGKTVKVYAKAVVIASGGFANNKEMLEKYAPVGPNMMVFGTIGKTGDGVKMAWAVGAAGEGTQVIQRGLAGIKKHKGRKKLKKAKGASGSGFDHQLTAILKQPHLWVNARGERFFNEAVFSFAHIGNAMSKQPDQILFNIFDEDTKVYLKEHGTDIALGVFCPAGTKLTTIDDILQQGIDNGEAWTAESIQSLAEKIGINAATLLATVDKYNTSCDKGHDDLFVKNPKFLKPVRKTKFYAIRGFPTFVGTLGGIKINSKTEVVKQNWDIIPGLYAVGNCAGGMYGDTYDASTTLGGTLAFAINSGRIAGENALKYIGK